VTVTDMKDAMRGMIEKGGKAVAVSRAFRLMQRFQGVKVGKMRTDIAIDIAAGMNSDIAEAVKANESAATALRGTNTNTASGRGVLVEETKTRPESA